MDAFSDPSPDPTPPHNIVNPPSKRLGRPPSSDLPRGMRLQLRFQAPRRAGVLQAKKTRSQVKSSQVKGCKAQSSQVKSSQGLQSAVKRSTLRKKRSVVSLPFFFRCLDP